MTILRAVLNRLRERPVTTAEMMTMLEPEMVIGFRKCIRPRCGACRMPCSFRCDRHDDRSPSAIEAGYRRQRVKELSELSLALPPLTFSRVIRDWLALEISSLSVETVEERGGLHGAQVVIEDCLISSCNNIRVLGRLFCRAHGSRPVKRCTLINVLYGRAAALLLLEREMDPIGSAAFRARVFFEERLNHLDDLVVESDLEWFVVQADPPKSHSIKVHDRKIDL